MNSPIILNAKRFIRSCYVMDKEKFDQKDKYMINEKCMELKGIYDENGNECTKVRESDQTFIVRKSPVQIIDYSLNCIGFDLKGALRAAKLLLNLDKKYMLPVLVNHIKEIVLFPTHSMKNEKNIWLNPKHIKKTFSEKRNTLVYFSNGETTIIEKRQIYFNSHFQTAMQYLENIIENAKNPSLLPYDPDLFRKRW